MRPNRNPSPLPLLDHFGISLLDETSKPSERLASPITQLLNSRIYQLRGRVSSFFLLRAPRVLLHVCRRFLHGCCRPLVTSVSQLSARPSASRLNFGQVDHVGSG